MRVKIGDTWYSAEDQWLCVELSESELEYVQSQDPNQWTNRRLAAGEAEDPEALRTWMRKG
ncbi:hypothetical protein HMPREF1487_04344 [Pseudomonas sp. HPB0071]|nr:hypothetical protein HMPREF1487_04344 [Pseudomonas sp. HPB0071]